MNKENKKSKPISRFKQIFQEAEQVESMFGELYEMLDDGDIDEQTITDTMQAHQDSLASNLAGYHAYSQLLKNEAVPFAERAKALAARAKKLENFSKFIEAHILNCMVKGRIDKLETSYGTVKLAKCPASPRVLDKKLVPKECYFEPKPPEISKSKLTAYLKQNGNQEFAELVTDKKRLNFR